MNGGRADEQLGRARCDREPSPRCTLELLSRGRRPDPIVVAHHERFDGHGYPHGLAGDRIPHTARVIGVAELYDTITGDGSYRSPPMSKSDAIREIQRVAGSRQCVEALVDVLHSSTTSWNATETSHDHDGRAFAAAVVLAKQSDVGRRSGDG
jgi:HD-GYP domain-containing protein (c-di-GMP phosphodiesterase class II)